MAHCSEDLFVAVDPFHGLELGLVERSFLDYLEARFPEIVTPDPPYDMFVAHIDGRRVRAIPARWAETKRRLISLTNQYGSVYIVAAPLGGSFDVRTMLTDAGFAPAGHGG